MGSIASMDFHLIDCWPGYPALNTPIPSGGFDATAGGAHSTTAIYPPGTKIQAYHDHTVGKGGSTVANKGYYTMMYAQYLDYTSADDISATAILVQACTSDKARGGMALTKDITGGNDYSQSGAVGIPCSSLAKSEFGWFWVDGVCPSGDLSRFDCTGFLTDGAIVGSGPLTSNVAGVDATESCAAGFSTPLADGTYVLTIVAFAYTDDT